VAFDPPGADGRIEGRSALAHPDLLARFVGAAVAGRATMVSELSAPGPSPYRAEAPLLWATIGATQDWDALVWMSYADYGWQPDVSRLAATLDLRTGPSQLVQMPVASALFRGEWLAPASGRLWLRQAPEVVREALLTAELHLRDQDDVPRALQSPMTLLTRRVRTLLHTGETDAAGEVGNVGWHPEPGILIVDPPYVQARVGPPGTAAAGGVGPRLPAGLGVTLDQFAAVALVSLDDLPLGESRRAMLTVATTQANTGQTLGFGGQEVIAAGSAPVLLAPARGTVWVRWPTRPTVQPMDGAGALLLPLPVRRRGGGWEVSLDAARSPWFLVSSG
jgi:hypothetical protein